MLRKNQEITDKTEIESIIRQSVVCRLALSDEGQPYIIPLCFGYQDDTLYFHTGRKGKKLDILRKNPKVCFEFENDVKILKGKNPCKWSMIYRSVIGSGKAVLLEGNTTTEEKRKAVDIIVRQYLKHGDSALVPDINIEKIVIIKVSVDNITGKYSGNFGA